MRVDGRIRLIRYVWTGIRKEKVADSKIYGYVLKEPQLIVIVQDVNRIRVFQRFLSLQLLTRCWLKG